jgi:hypothetical protein
MAVLLPPKDEASLCGIIMYVAQQSKSTTNVHILPFTQRLIKVTAENFLLCIIAIERQSPYGFQAPFNREFRSM